SNYFHQSNTEHWPKQDGTFSLVHTAPGVLYVANLRRCGRIAPVLDRDEIEAVAVSGEPESGPPELGQPAQDFALALVDRLLRMPEAHRRAGLDLDERNQVSQPGHEVHVVMSEPEAVGLDAPPRAQQMRHGDSLAGV